jgi:hypothetical protein
MCQWFRGLASARTAIDRHHARAFGKYIGKSTADGAPSRRTNRATCQRLSLSIDPASTARELWMTREGWDGSPARCYQSAEMTKRCNVFASDSNIRFDRILASSRLLRALHASALISSPFSHGPICGVRQRFQEKGTCSR